MATAFTFDVVAECHRARSGVVRTPDGTIDTPAFMPVGTAGTVKAMFPEHVAKTGAQVILGNTYHLMLRPSAERIQRLGGLHKFMNWSRPILTDSGGFQVMSLQKLRTVTEEGVAFRSFIDGSKHFLTPERSIAIQGMLGSNIAMSFDECTPYPIDKNGAAASMQRSMRWAKRGKDAFGERTGFALFGIQQGSVYQELREESTTSLVQHDFDGYAVGGLAVGEGQDTMFEVLDYAASLLPRDKPRYLMGVGKPSDIVGAVRRGVDMFDCVLPSRSGRNGQAFTHHGVLNIKNAQFADDQASLDEFCDCPACTNYSRAYLHHVFRSNEIISSMLLTWHNLRFYQILMAKIRSAIRQGTFERLSQNYLLTGQLAGGD